MAQPQTSYNAVAVVPQIKCVQISRVDASLRRAHHGNIQPCLQNTAPIMFHFFKPFEFLSYAVVLPPKSFFATHSSALGITHQFCTAHRPRSRERKVLLNYLCMQIAFLKGRSFLPTL